MAPIRHDDSPAASTSHSKTSVSKRSSKPYSKPQRRRHNEDESSLMALPGVQKIKSALRQTRRLLAKDNLAADVRTKTERKLRALEADLIQAEHARKERTMSARYHAVKFFERQKVTRRIQQVKRQLARNDEREEANSGKKERKKLEKKLEELRVDLNYILHYPKFKKYISLFPPELRTQPREHPDPYPHLYSDTTKHSSDVATSKAESGTDAEREEVRAWVREKMAAGKMSTEPEVEMQSQNGRKASHAPVNSGKSVKEASLGDQFGDKKPKQVKETAVVKGLREDAFFGDDGSNNEESNEDEEESNGSNEDDSAEEDGDGSWEMED